MSLVLALAATAGCKDTPPSTPVAAEPRPAPPPPRAHLQKLRGQVTVKRANGDEWVRATEKMALFASDKVATAEGARVELVFRTGGTVTVGENALVGLAETGALAGQAPTDVTVLQGRVDAVLQRPDRQTLSVDTPEATVRAGREVVFQ
ncbi:MAG: FecR family protein [Myxococcaceae bacterium]|nr:FecR family protein [Myxococcaceae bacterium]MCI0670745.1 FecR family protein [Myxococcaceae bacterium]